MQFNFEITDSVGRSQKREKLPQLWLDSMMAISLVLAFASLTLYTALVSASGGSRYPNIAFGINVGGKVGPDTGTT